jgi:hypothetical protein
VAVTVITAVVFSATLAVAALVIAGVLSLTAVTGRRWPGGDASCPVAHLHGHVVTLLAPLSVGDS